MLLQWHEGWEPQRSSTTGRHQEVMPHPAWMLVPWGMFAVGAAIKFWRLTSPFRRQRTGIPNSTEHSRQTLERIWERDQQTA